MGYLYFDESIREKGQFIIGALVYSPSDLTPLVHREWELLGLDPLQHEYKSSTIKDGNKAAQEQRFRVHSILCKARLGLVVSPVSYRKQLGDYAVALTHQLLKVGCIPREEHILFLDQNIFISKLAKLSASDTGVSVREEQDSRICAGIQLADLAAHLLGGMLLESMGLLRKTVSGEKLRYDFETRVEIGFEFWASLRYIFLSSPQPVRALIGDDSTAYPVFKVEGYGLYVAPSCSEELRTHAIGRFGENYLGCIH